jgi:deoxyribodipyrimidine photo-lyase|tara:strand:+ start:1193 stop:2554 length:1362 start_codon:yes stop_codon:yes gene_type:complete
MKRTLYWLTKDLRISDNLALKLASDSDYLLCVYVVDQKWFKSNNYQSKPLGNNRWSFLQDCLSDFNQSLLSLGQQLHIIYDDTLPTLAGLCEKHHITDVITTRLPGTYENRLINQLGDIFPQMSVNKVEQFTLFSHETLPYKLQHLPVSYSKFKKTMANVAIPDITPAIQSLPSQFTSVSLPSISRPSWLPVNSFKNSKYGMKFDGGEASATKHLNQYFSSDLPLNYKSVRNNLQGWESSSKLSPWLGYGCISPRQVMASINQFEMHREKNSSTECLAAEIIWREYFQWSHFKVGAKTYRFKGISNNPPLTSFYPERFSKWCLGITPYPLVNACMNELRITGYLSNRGRQIVASCLVNELSVDWRYGAAWFEEQLIDYDAAVNWGNWQYIAGVGVDPRGGRHFNIEKQAAIFDPDGKYQSRWTSKCDKSVLSNQPLDSVDAADWPVSMAKDNG